MFHPRSRTLVALLLALTTAFSAAQTTGIMPRLVSAENTLSLQFLQAPTSTESSSASGTVEVNLQSGHMKIELKQATPNSAYVTLFATSSIKIQLGTITTDSGGQGSLETTLGAGTYVGLFQITRIGILQFVTSDTSFTVTGTLSSTVTSSETSSATSNETSTSQTANVTTTFQVDPTLRTISAGAFAKYNINIHATDNANVLLAARGIPPRSVAIFTQNLGVANPEFHSTLTIVTSTDTPSGSYGIILIALINGQEFDAQIGLEVAASSNTTTSQTITASVSLNIGLSTDHHSYHPNATVNLQGHVTDDSGSAVADARVSVQVDGPTGAEIVFLSSLKTDTAGVFNVNFKLSANPTAGTYTAFATATKGGFASATTHTTFVVGTSSTPSVVIKEVYASDMSGTRTTTFSAGQTVLVWMVVENSGATFEGVIWVQIRDPNGTPVLIQFQISQLGTGQTVKVAFGFTISANMTKGLYTANALVSDRLISQGGTFFASSSTEFALTV